jgi:hypothetical protein
MRALIALVLHLGGVGKYVSQIWGWSVHSLESGDLHCLPWFSCRKIIH